MKNEKVNGTTYRIQGELLDDFNRAWARRHKNNATDIVRQLMMAYIQLVKKAGDNPIHTLEFKGFEEKGDCIRAIAPTLLHVAERKAGYGAGTSRTKELARK